MTYEEYKNKKEDKKSNIIKVLLNKLFTIIIFSMLVLIVSNYSPRFKNFIINDVFNSTMDFSGVNKLLNKFTSVFKNENIKEVALVSKDEEKYLDGYKYYVSDNADIVARESGIVTFIGTKDGYKNTIIIQQSNGYYAWYGNVKESIKLYDYVEKGSVIGNSSDEYYYALFKDDKSVSLNEN